MASAESGRRIVLAIVFATVGVSAIVIILFVAANGFATLPPRLVRFALTVALGVLLYRGAAWARWTVVILYSIASIGSLAGASQLLTSGYPGRAMPGVAMGVIYGASVLSLLLVPSVRAHFARAQAAQQGAAADEPQHHSIGP
jgi:hypothetical protein